MKPENWITLGGVAVTAVLTTIGLILGPKRAVRLALEQFRAERWWEKKAAAYDDVVRSASRLCSFHCDCVDSLRLGYQLNEEWSKESREKYKEAQTILERYCFSGGFLVSEETENSIKRILHCLESDGESDYDYHDRVSSSLLKEVAAIKQFGARDLNIAHSSSSIKRLFARIDQWVNSDAPNALASRYDKGSLTSPAPTPDTPRSTGT